MYILKKITELVKLKNNILPESHFIDNEQRHLILSERGNLDSHFPSDFSKQERENIQSVVKYTMTSYERLVALSRAVDYIVQNNIPGDIVECGVWKGGSMMLTAKRLMQLNCIDKHLYLFDTFEGMTVPGVEDVAISDQEKAADIYNTFQGDDKWCYSPLDEVKATMTGTGYPGKNISFIKGKVEDTLPYEGLEKISLLRLDTDWYESTKHELECLYDKLVVGGVLVIDDYGHWDGCRKAVDEFIASRQLKIFLIRVDYTARIAVKLG